MAGRGKINDEVLLDKWLTCDESKVRNRLVLIMRNEILKLRAENKELEDRTNDYSEI